MRTELFAVCALGCLLAFAPRMAVKSDTEAQPARPEACDRIGQAPIARTVTFESPAVARAMRYDVLLPSGYGESDARYPVLYLLHGVGSDHRAWNAEGGVARQVACLDPWIVVMPDAGNSWYVNWSAAERPDANRWEDFIVRDLVAHVDRTFRTIPQRAGRVLAGRSMGGYGALVLGLRNPDRFASIGSSSGYLDFARGAVRALELGDTPRPRRRRRAASSEPSPAQEWASHIRTDGFRSRAERTPSGRAFLDADNAAAHDPFALVREVPRELLPHIILDCGTDDVLLPFTLELARILLAEGLPFDYSQLPGGHDGAYWERALEHTLPIHQAVLRRQGASP